MHDKDALDFSAEVDTLDDETESDGIEVDEPSENSVRTAYMHIIDPVALGALLSLSQGGVVDAQLPLAEVAVNVCPQMTDSCVICRAKGSLASSNVMEGLGKSEPCLDGTLILGTQYIPIMAFNQRTYDAVMEKVAEALSGFDRVIARPFYHGQPQKPIASVGNFCVEVGQDYCYPGHVGEEYTAWVIAGGAENMLTGTLTVW